MTYTQIFGGNTIYPSDVSLLALTLTGDVQLDWPLEGSPTETPAARIIDITTAADYDLSLPDATLTGAGQTILLNNLTASTSLFTVKDFAGNTIATVAPGEQWQFYLASTATAAGVWRAFRFGASTATVQPADLAGYGITTTSNTLSQSMPVATFNTTPRTVLDTDRARALVWNGSGSGVLNLPTAADVGNNFYVTTRNSGGGTLTIDPSGSELVDGDNSLILQPGDSATLATDGIDWYSVGLGQQAVFAFDFTSVALTGGTYTLTGSELNRITYRFTGTLTSDATVIVPPTVQQYWVDNATTGPFTLTVTTAAGTGVAVTQGGRGIYYCDGTNFIDADTSTVSLPVSAANGGTGQTSYAIGDLLYASAPTALSKLSDVAVGNALLSGGVGVAPVWGKIGLTTHVTGVLPVTNGGTGQSAFTAGYLVKGSGGSPLASSLLYDDGTNVAIGTTSPADKFHVVGVIRSSSGGFRFPDGTTQTTAATATGTVTSVNASGSTTGLTFSGGPVTTSGTLTLGGTLAVGNGGTGATDAATARSNLGAGTVNSVGGTGSVNGLTLTGTVTASGNLTLGGSITSVGATATVNSFVIGYRSVPRSTTSGTAVAGDSAKCIAVSAGLTVPAATFAAGDAFSIYNDSASPVTITQGGGLTLRWAGTTSTGNRTLGARGLATVWFNSASEAIISGAGVS